MKSVLVLLNDLSLLENIMEALTYEGYYVMSAFGLPSLEIVRCIKPDIVFSEINSDIISNVKDLASIKNEKATSCIKFIFIDSGEAPEDKTELRNNGADAFIEQPFSLKQIRTTFDFVLRA
jgi:DNA-binding response OmpR family regulator